MVQDMKKWFSLIGFLLLIIVSIVMWHGETAVSAQGNANTYLPLIYNNYDSTVAPIFGVQIYSSTHPDNTYYDSLIGTNATWVRNRVSWRNIEPNDVTPAVYNWGTADTAYMAARSDAGGLNFIGTIEFAPDWAAPAENGPIYPEALDDFAEFIGALVERFDGDGLADAPGSPKINYWEFYNEPDNSSDSIGNPNYTDPMHWGDHGAEYANMLATVYPVIKSANPQAQVVMGGLAFDWFEDDGGPFVEDFLNDVLAAGGGDYFDVMNFHSYPAFHDNWTDNLGPGLLDKAEIIREVMANHGVEKPMVVTEAGWTSSTAPGSLIPGTPETQSRYVVELFTESMAAQLDAMIWWLLVDPSFPYPFQNGLVTQGPPVVPKMSYYVFQDVVAELGTAHFVHALSEAETGHPLMEAYLFHDNVLDRDLYVVWLNPVDTTEIAPVRLPVAMATVKDSLTGTSLIVQDSDDGIVDGRIRVDVGANPLYVEVGQ